MFNQIIPFVDRWKDYGQSLKNLLMQLKTIELAYLKCKQHHCDFYIFIRPDILIHEEISIKKFIKDYTNKHAVLLPSWQWYGGISDRFAIVAQTAADAYGLRFNQTLDYCKHFQKPLHSETFLRDQLSIHRIKSGYLIQKCLVYVQMAWLRKRHFSAVKRMGGFKQACFAQLHQLNNRDILFGLIKIATYYIIKFIKK